jgi:hypothetical protein
MTQKNNINVGMAIPYSVKKQILSTDETIRN